MTLVPGVLGLCRAVYFADFRGFAVTAFGLLETELDSDIAKLTLPQTT